MTHANDEDKIVSFKFGVAFGQFSGVQSDRNYAAVRNVLSQRMLSDLPSYAELKNTLWWNFDATQPCFRGIGELYEYFNIGMIAYYRFLLSLPGHPNPEKKLQDIDQVEKQLTETFAHLGHNHSVLDNFLTSLNGDPNDALRKFVDEFEQFVIKNMSKRPDSGHGKVPHDLTEDNGVHIASSHGPNEDFGTDLASALARGQEIPTLEFKQTLRCRVRDGERDQKVTWDIMRTIGGFCNVKSGGTLIVGLNNRGQPTRYIVEADKFGDEDQLLQWLAEQLVSWIGPAAASLVTLDFKLVQESRVLVLGCRKGRTPTYVKSPEKHQASEFFIRVGTTTRQVYGTEQLEYIRQWFPT